MLSIFMIFSESFSNVQKRCHECVHLERGVCNPNEDDICICYNGYQGDYCHSKTTELPLQSSPTSNWIIIVAVISAIAGLLLIISIFMCIFYIIKRFHHSRFR
jgi:hypothetical protein